MFRQAIMSSPFCTRTANMCFPNILGTDYNGDLSFTATLRAVLAPRLKDERFIFRLRAASYSASQIKGWSDQELAEDIAAGYLPVFERGMLHVQLFTNGSSEINARCVNVMQAHALTYLGGGSWVCVEKVTAMFRQRKFSVVCFINPELQASVVFVEGGDLRKYHMIQSGISVYLPWYFEGENKLTEEELKLMNILFNSKEADDYISYIQNMSLKYEFDTMKVKHLLSGFEKTIDENRRSKIFDEITSIDNEIVNLNRQISSYITTRNEKSIMLMGIDEKLASDSEESEIMTYFLRNKCLVLEDVRGSTIKFGVKSYLMYYDESLVEAMLGRRSSYIYSKQSGDISADDMALLIRWIFVEQMLKLRICAAYSLTLGEGARAEQYFEFGDSYRGYLPNPHIQRFACLGNNAAKLNELMRDNNYIGAVEQCCSSCRSLNFGDGTVISQFMATMYSDNHEFNELPSGEVVTPSKAIEWIKAQIAPVQTEEAENE